ncbi:MAG: hypothetical protein LQ350_001585 [Teloschistes chrysophthalmus]|nr:MAG: hypothetical protein LQ350_001585 [Niorma chrysophthalma]
MDRYGRPLSPGGRRVSQPGRSSTGTLVYPSSFDPYYAPTRSNRDFSTAAGPRTSAERVAQPRAVPRYRPESPPGRQARDDYAVRPRRLTIDPDAAESRRPLNVIGSGSPNRSSRPIITTSDRPASPPSKLGRSRQDEPYYLQPAASTRREHRRNYTVDSTDSSRIFAEERGGYRSSVIGSGRSGYNLNPPSVRQSGELDRGGYEYTNPREQMYRDTEPRPRQRRESYSGGGRERPLSMPGLEDYLPRLERTNRDAGPPVSMRGFGNLGRAGSLRQGPSSRDYDPAPSDFSRDDYERRKAHIPRVAVHQKPDDGYSSYRDDESAYDDSRDRRPRKTAFEDEVVSTKPREVYNEELDRQRRAKTNADTGKIDTRPKDRYPEDYDRTGEEKARRHHDKGHQRDDRDGDRDVRRREDATREGRVDATRDRREDPYRERREELPRERRDDGYRERRDDVPREKRYHDNGLILGGAAATAGLATEAARSQHRHKEAPADRDARRDPPRESDRDRLAVRDPAESTSASTVSRESDEERRERRRRRRERRDREIREAQESEERQRRKAPEPALAVPQDLAIREPVSRESLPREPAPREPERRRDIDDLAPPRDNLIREQPSYERRPNEGRLDVAEPLKPQPRGRHHHSRNRDYDSFSDSSSSSEDSRRPRDVRVVTPPSERAPSQPPPQPKSILRAPREKFPEDPAPVREGVAPLKDAGKKGIPPNARWTKIARKHVNPEALEAGNERYEERPDCVIVLRVLTKEEIDLYAAKTQELRAERAERAERERAQQVAAGLPPSHPPPPPQQITAPPPPPPPQQGNNAKAGRPEASGMPEWG